MPHGFAEQSFRAGRVGAGFVEHLRAAAGEGGESGIGVGLDPAPVARLGGRVGGQQRAQGRIAPHAGVERGQAVGVVGGGVEQEGGVGGAGRALHRVVEVGAELRRQRAVQGELVVKGAVRQIDQVAEVGVGRLPGQPAEDPHVVEQVQVVLFEPGAEHRLGQVARGDAGDGGMAALLLDERAADFLQVRGKTHARSLAHPRPLPVRGRPTATGARPTCAPATRPSLLRCVVG